MIFNKDYRLINLYCHICNDDYHESNYCSQCHCIPDKSTVVNCYQKEELRVINREKKDRRKNRFAMFTRL